MRDTSCSARNTEPFRIKPCLGQRPENSMNPPSIDRWDVLHNNDFRLQLDNDANGLKEQPRTTPVNSGWLVCCVSDADILTRESTAHDGDWLKVVFSALPDVAFSVDVGPVLREDFRRVVIDFNLPLADHAGPLKT